MARNINEIFTEQKNELIRLATEAGDADMVEMLEQNTSAFAKWRRVMFAFAYGAWVLETLWDKMVILIQAMIDALTPHHRRWYRTKALAFQYGFDLLPQSDKYDNTGATAQQITDSKVVKYAAVNETEIDGKRVLLVKVAGVDGGGNLVQLTNDQEAAFIAYTERIKDAGNNLVIYNRPADILKAVIDVYYNPLLLDENGNAINGTGKPVEEAAKAFLLELPFDGEFSNAAFVDKLQGAVGVSNRNAFLVLMQRKIGANVYQAVANTFIPEAGYTKYDDADGLTINYIAHV